jgi:hypothetical protein
MEDWSYRTKELWQLHKREIKRYGCCVALVFAGVSQGCYAAAWIGLGAALVMWAFDRWGRPWAERGRMIMNRKKSDSPHA